MPRPEAVVRKLKLQMQITVDGFVAGPEGQLDWMTWAMDERAIAFVNELTDSSDTILMGRKMTEGFVNHWEGVTPDSPQYEFAQKMVNIPKIVFSKTVTHMNGRNVRVENGPLVEAVNRLKGQPGKDIIVYGGATFVGSLVENDLIDELNLIVNPIAIGDGMRIFNARKPLTLTSSMAFSTGKVANTYERRS